MTSQLAPHHAAQLTTIAPDIQAERGYQTVNSTEELARIDGDLSFAQRRVPALAIPVYRLCVKHTLVIRPDEPRVIDDRKLKYEWPAGKPSVLDVLPRYRDALCDASKELWITEGAKKSDAIATHLPDVVPVNISGVWSWQKKDIDENYSRLEDWRDVALRGRKVVLAFDSDVIIKKEVRRALEALAAYLEVRGAHVYECRLPHDDRKLGIDDAFAAGYTVDQILAMVKHVSAEINHTDLGNARRLILRHGDNIRYVHKWDKWLIWDGTRWQIDETGAIQRMARNTVRGIYEEAAKAHDGQQKVIAKWAATSESRTRLDAMVALAQDEAGIAVQHEQLDALAHLLNVANGTIDLRTGELLPHNRDHLLTGCIDVHYDPTAQAPTWGRFLDRVMSDDQEMIAFLKRAIGYSFAGDVSAQCLFFLYGGGANGKSTFVETIQTLLGAYAQKAPASMLMYKTGNAVPNDVARLRGARFVIASEIEEGRRFDEALVKDLTGGDKITARFMKKDFFEFTPTHKLWIYGNHKPVIRGTDDGIWRRIRLIPFLVQIPESERDPRLKEKLINELPGILAWAVAGAVEWYQHGLQEPQVVRQATQGYRSEMDTIAAFLDECCEASASVKVTGADLYQVYERWCAETNERPLAKRQFNDRLRARGLHDAHGAGNKLTWYGIGLIKDDILEVAVTSGNSKLPIEGKTDITERNKNPHEGISEIGNSSNPGNSGVSTEKINERLGNLAPDLYALGWRCSYVDGYRLKCNDKQTEPFTTLNDAIKAAHTLREIAA